MVIRLGRRARSGWEGQWLSGGRLILFFSIGTEWGGYLWWAKPDGVTPHNWLCSTPIKLPIDRAEWGERSRDNCGFAEGG